MSSHTTETKEYVAGDSPTSALTVEARLESPPRAICEVQRHEPAARLTYDSYALDGPARLIYGFMGVAEMGIAAMFTFLPRREQDNHLALDVSAGVLAVDGLASLLMAFLIPDTHYRDVTSAPAQDWTTPECPPGVAFEAAGRAFPVDASGRLQPEHGQALMAAVVETGSAVALRWSGDLRWTPVPPETRCAWAVELGHDLAPALCPRALAGPGP